MFHVKHCRRRRRAAGGPPSSSRPARRGLVAAEVGRDQGKRRRRHALHPLGLRQRARPPAQHLLPELEWRGRAGWKNRCSPGCRALPRVAAGRCRPPVASGRPHRRLGVAAARQSWHRCRRVRARSPARRSRRHLRQRQQVVGRAAHAVPVQHQAVPGGGVRRHAERSGRAPSPGRGARPARQSGGAAPHPPSQVRRPKASAAGRHCRPAGSAGTRPAR